MDMFDTLRVGRDGVEGSGAASCIAGRRHAQGGYDERNRCDAMGNGDARARNGIVASAPVELSERTAGEDRLHGGSEERTQGAGGEPTLHWAEGGFVERSPKVCTCQDGDDGGAHLGAEQPFAAAAARSRQRQRGARPERRGEHMKGQNGHQCLLHDIAPLLRYN
jgi:hypothetical protein